MVAPSRGIDDVMAWTRPGAVGVTGSVRGCGIDLATHWSLERSTIDTIVATLDDFVKTNCQTF